MDIDRAGLAVIIGAPNGGKQTVAAEHLTRVFQKQPQQIVLLEREGNRRTVYLYHMAAFIHENAALPQNGWSGLGAGSAQHCPNAGDHFHHTKRFGEIIIRA